MGKQNAARGPKVHKRQVNSVGHCPPHPRMYFTFKFHFTPRLVNGCGLVGLLAIKQAETSRHQSAILLMKGLYYEGQTGESI
jgi:hypothetical protein